MRVLVGCEESGIVRDAFIAKGHDAMSCDLFPTAKPGPHYQGDIFDVIDYPWDLAVFHPPCTHTSCSGARHFAAKRMDGRQQSAVSFFMRLVRWSEHIPKTCFEQPMSIISTLYRKRDQVIQPYEYGHGETKETWLWLKGLPHLIPTEVVSGREHRIWKMAPGPERAKERSRTFAGIAKAMAEQWG